MKAKKTKRGDVYIEQSKQRKALTKHDEHERFITVPPLKTFSPDKERKKVRFAGGGVFKGIIGVKSARETKGPLLEVDLREDGGSVLEPTDETLGFRITLVVEHVRRRVEANNGVAKCLTDGRSLEISNDNGLFPICVLASEEHTVRKAMGRSGHIRAAD
ncbi:hypothetical protein BDK51DRAFT_28474 [Blyttiomyces helicus]|uniref:Uncharacterized protein n=1 Tax=Blyttiomyces helicus TaxID=388810 RepID=A0A4P9WJZ7_9FUNG|nr:hypothetical protein BDK51DRAFT_28474 [Blyttiomyces helicus]|eukprot:RKO93114.1 hypothetical protein BDK51DRAFT_28474 [Blyttiomyces helicus]